MAHDRSALNWQVVFVLCSGSGGGLAKCEVTARRILPSSPVQKTWMWNILASTRLNNA